MSLITHIVRKSCGMQWKKGEKIGQGPNGRVYQGFNLNSGQMIAIKVVNVLKYLLILLDGK
jgi:hypothetical protein